jgi:hypothetical protein
VNSLYPPEPREHWQRCPAHEDRTGDEDRCMCDQIAADDGDRRHDERKENGR